MITNWNLKIILLIGLFFTLVLAASAEAHLCDDSEKPYFSCRLKDMNTEVSLCGDEAGNFVQFRQNLLGKKQVVYPLQKSNSSKKFEKKNITDRSGSQVQLLTFQKGLHAYEIFAKKSADANYQGVVIKRAPHMELLNKYLCEEKGLIKLKLKQIPTVALKR